MKASSNEPVSSMSEPENVVVPTRDDAHVHLSHYRGSCDGQAVIMISPAMGAPAKAYASLAEFFSSNGHAVVLFDHRGSGRAGLVPNRNLDWGIHEYVFSDWPAAVDWLNARYPDSPLVLMGHSLGGQLNSVYAGTNHLPIDGLVNICTAWIHYKELGSWPVQFGGLVFYWLMRCMAKILGYAPGDRIGWGARFARQHIMDWSSWGIDGKYQFEGGDGKAAINSVSAKTLAISFSDDHRLAPRPACERFCSELKSADLTHWHLSPNEIGKESVGHFGVLQDADQLWAQILDWITSNVSVQKKPDNSGVPL